MDDESYRKGIVEFEQVLAIPSLSLSEKAEQISAMWNNTATGLIGNINSRAGFIQSILESENYSCVNDREIILAGVENIKLASEKMIV
jgi:hypothetical protein